MQNAGQASSTITFNNEAQACQIKACQITVQQAQNNFKNSFYNPQDIENNYDSGRYADTNLPLATTNSNSESDSMVLDESVLADTNNIFRSAANATLTPCAGAIAKSSAVTPSYPSLLLTKEVLGDSNNLKELPQLSSFCLTPWKDLLSKSGNHTFIDTNSNLSMVRPSLDWAGTKLNNTKPKLVRKDSPMLGKRQGAARLKRRNGGQSSVCKQPSDNELAERSGKEVLRQISKKMRTASSGPSVQARSTSALSSEGSSSKLISVRPCGDNVLVRINLGGLG